MGLDTTQFFLCFGTLYDFWLRNAQYKIFIAAIPMAFTAYIIAFSDFILAKEIVEDATANREDEK